MNQEGCCSLGFEFVADFNYHSGVDIAYSDLGLRR